jgi:hypothetical protein
MDKKYLYHLWKQIRPIKTWYLLAAFLVAGLVGAFALRNNNLTMVKLRNDVYQADKDNGDVEASLQALRSYVNSHMNTNLTGGTDAVYPPIQLKYTYQRLQQAELAKANSANSQIYTDAQHTCEQLYPGSVSGGPRVPCIENYVSQHDTKAKSIPDSIYKFDFVSPNWSPDFAGMSLVIAAFFLALALLRLVAGKVLRAYTR